MSDKVLVLGGSGFIGQNLQVSKHLSSFKVLNVDMSHNPPINNNWEFLRLDSSNFEDLSLVVKDFSPMMVIHLAANSDIRKSSSDLSLDYRNTLMTTVSLLEAIKNCPAPPTVVFTSSSAVYGNMAVVETDVEGYLPISRYGECKLASEQVLKGGVQKGLISKLLIARLPNVVGQYMTHGLIFDLVRKYLSNPFSIQVLGDGTQSKPYMLASDLLNQIFKDLDHFPEDNFVKTYEYGPTDTISVKEIAEVLVSKLPTKPSLHFQSSKTGWDGDVPKYRLGMEIRSPSSGDANSSLAINCAIDFALSEADV